MTPQPTTTPSEDELEDLLLSCRYGETGEVQDFVGKFGTRHFESARDGRGNTVLHMCCGNGHADVLALVEPYLSDELYMTTNESGTPPLHWAILNNHLPIIQRVCSTSSPSSSSAAPPSAPSPSTNKQNPPNPSDTSNPSTPHPAPPYIPPTPARKAHLLALLSQKNSAGREALHEAVWAGDGKEEVAGWLEGLLDKLDPVLGEDEKGEEDKRDSAETRTTGSVVEKADVPEAHDRRVDEVKDEDVKAITADVDAVSL